MPKPTRKKTTNARANTVLCSLIKLWRKPPLLAMSGGLQFNILLASHQSAAQLSVSSCVLYGLRLSPQDRYSPSALTEGCLWGESGGRAANPERRGNCSLLIFNEASGEQDERSGTIKFMLAVLHLGGGIHSAHIKANSRGKQCQTNTKQKQRMRC